MLQLVQGGLDPFEETSPLGFDQDSQDPDEPEAEPGCFGPAQAFIHEQEIGTEFGGQGDRLRFAAVELAFKGRHHSWIADVSADDPVESLDFSRSGSAKTSNRDLVIDSLRNGYDAIELAQQVQASHGSETDQR